MRGKHAKGSGAERMTKAWREDSISGSGIFKSYAVVGFTGIQCIGTDIMHCLTLCMLEQCLHLRRTPSRPLLTTWLPCKRLAPDDKGFLYPIHDLL